MSAKTKIVVLRMKEIIYTAIFVGLGILLITLFLIMFRPQKASVETGSGDGIYVPGVYTSSIVLGSQNVNVEVSVDAEKITAITWRPLSESVTTMYPLMEPALNDLAEQICATQSLENLEYSSESQYTSMALIKTIKEALHKAETGGK